MGAILETNVTVTLARCTAGTAWTTETITGVSWYDKADGTMIERGQQAGREICCRIPADRAPSPKMLPRIGDYLIKGALTGFSSIADLKGLDFGKVTGVTDNRRGVASLQHIRVTAS